MTRVNKGMGRHKAKGRRKSAHTIKCPGHSALITSVGCGEWVNLNLHGECVLQYLVSDSGDQ